MKRHRNNRRAIGAVVLVGGLVILTACEGYTEKKAREDVLRQDLYAMRSVLDQHFLDKKQRPQSLNELVTAGYLKEIPIDPMTGRRDWVLSEDPDSKTPGIIDIHSRSHAIGRTGKPYSDW